MLSPLNITYIVVGTILGVVIIILLIYNYIIKKNDFINNDSGVWFRKDWKKRIRVLTPESVISTNAKFFASSIKEQEFVNMIVLNPKYLILIFNPINKKAISVTSSRGTFILKDLKAGNFFLSPETKNVLDRYQKVANPFEIAKKTYFLIPANNENFASKDFFDKYFFFSQKQFENTFLKVLKIAEAKDVPLWSSEDFAKLEKLLATTHKMKFMFWKF